MTYTWGGDPSNSTLEEVRHYVGDIDSARPLLTDEDINFELGKVGNDAVTAADRCFRRALSRLAPTAFDRSGTKFSASRSQRFNQVSDAYKLFKEEFGASISPVGWSEHSVSDVTSIESDSDFRQPRFKTGQFDNS